MTIACIPLTSLPATRRDSTIFEQVYGVRPRRPTSIHLRLSNTHRWSGSDVDRPTPVTPPSSDYTDAYLSAFAPKPVTTPYFHRRTAPLSFGFLSHHSIRTSPTRFNPTASRPAPSFSSQTTPIDTPSPSNLTPSPTVDRPASPYENLLEPSPIKVTYKPCVSFRSAPLPFIANIPSSRTTIQEKPDRPETILFQHDEDLQPSPVVSPLLDSPLTSEAAPVESQSSFSEEPVAVSSKPIEILENRYESLINQISEVLDSVSPLSSTISSLSPGKSVLDYDLSSDTSPILPHRAVETNNSPIVSARQTPSSHLIREDSYDKIVTAIADLDEEVIPPLDSPLATAEIDEVPEDNLDEPLEISTILTESSLATETVLSSIEGATSNKKREKRVTWDDTVVDNEGDESLSSESTTIEIQSTSIASEQPESANNPNEEPFVTIEDNVPPSQSDHPIETMKDGLETTDRSSSPPETSSSSFSDSLERQSSHTEHSSPTSTSSDNNNIEQLKFIPVESDGSLVDTSGSLLSDSPRGSRDEHEQVNEIASEFHLMPDKEFIAMQKNSIGAKELLAVMPSLLTSIREETESVIHDTSVISDSSPDSMRTNEGSTPPSASISEISETRSQARDERQSDSFSQDAEIEPFRLRSAIDHSPSNTEIDSLELIHALHGHSIAAPEKSSTSTASSQVTSSDRYVSYAIHEMGDSSQDRLPAAIPPAADLPVYRSADEQVPAKPFFFAHRPSIREEDITELDASENLTSFTDDILLQRSYSPTRQFDTSSTDDDVDDAEFEQQGANNLQDIVPQFQRESNESYQRYDLDTTPSSNEGSSSSSRQQAEDVYLIPGYPGLWRPSAESAAMNYDADDERRTESKTRTIVRTSDSARLQSFFHHQHEQTGTLTHPFRSTVDASESDSFHTCPSSQSKAEQRASDPALQESPEEKIFLIRERERGVSLPVSMKIDSDDIAIRLSTSTPALLRTSSLSLNSPVDTRTTLQKTAKGPISIAECDRQGHSITIENISRSKNIDLANWTLRQENEHGQTVLFLFPDPCLLRCNQTLKIWTTTSKRSEQKQDDLVATEISSWLTGSHVTTTLTNRDGKDCATLLFD